ncbi:MAG: cytochrome b561 [Candidatus Binatia bacterium]|nr:MAG: cytochrome b561 [Candidatus Binatia bacterium]
MLPTQETNFPAAPLVRPRTWNPFPWVRYLYDWVLHWAATPYGVAALGVLAFAEASFFPVPPDVLLVALCLASPRRSLWFATVCSVTSVVGGIGGYLIGAFVWEQVRPFFFAYVFSPSTFERVANLYRENALAAVFTAGLTPIPYKVFTIAAGVCDVNFPVFVVASVFGRSLRFFAVAGLIRLFGPPIKDFIDRYFNLLTVAFTVLLVGGFFVVRYLL